MFTHAVVCVNTSVSLLLTYVSLNEHTAIYFSIHFLIDI